MSLNKKLQVLIDFDDVLAECNKYALSLLAKETGQEYSMEDITGWDPIGAPVDERLKFFEDKTFFETQPAIDGARWFLNELMERAEVTIATAVNPKFAGERIRRISELFPEFPLNHVLLGSRKDLLHGDILIDDGLHNLLGTDVKLPVIFDRPWNRSVSGICRVKRYKEILTLVDFASGKKDFREMIPKIICLVGPSGSQKHELAAKLSESQFFERIGTVTTAKEKKDVGYNVTEEEFERMLRNKEFLENTAYTGDKYGVRKNDIDSALLRGNHAVVVMDISGCMSVYNAYPGRCKIFYIDRDKRDCIRSIITKPGLTEDQMADRIMSIDFERKNSVLADYVVDSELSIEDKVRNILMRV